MKFNNRDLILLTIAFYVAIAALALAAGDLVAKAYQLLNSGHPAEAVLEFEKVLAADPNDLRAHEGLAWAYHKLGDHKQALWHADRRQVLAPADLNWRRQRILLLFGDQARQPQALAEGRELVRERPRDIEARILLGRLLAWSAQHGEARQLIMSALAAEPRNPKGFRLLASLENQLHNYDEALLALQRAAKLQPGDSELQHELEIAEAKARRFRAIRYEPTMPLVLGAVGIAILIGHASPKLTRRTYVLVLASISIITGAALAWLYIIPL